jgi:hypothetical protein
MIAPKLGRAGGFLHGSIVPLERELSILYSFVYLLRVF